MSAEILVRPPRAEQPPKDLGITILRQARFALGWNNPVTAESTLAKNQARVTESARRAQVGSPGQRAEERYVLAKAKENIKRVRAAGLASGTMEEGATGMIFAIPASRERAAGQPTSIGDTPYELWYMPYQAVEKALALSYSDQASSKPQVDNYVYRAALGFIATQDDPHHEEQITRIDLHPIDEANLMDIARHMKSRGAHGRIPSRLDMINQRVLYSGQFHSRENIVELGTSHQPSAEQRTA